MISTHPAGVQPATLTETRSAATDTDTTAPFGPWAADPDAAVDLWPTETAERLAELAAQVPPMEVTEARPLVRFEYAIRLPSDAWWRALTTRCLDPEGTEPTVYGTPGAAEDELADVIGMARSVYGVGGQYRPRIEVRRVSVSASGSVSLGAWCPLHRGGGRRAARR